MLYYWIGFIACTSAIVYSGFKLSRYGDVMAEKLGLGRTWIGVVMLASATSLPELVTGIGSVTFAGVPDIAVGDVMGSCVFNMFLLVVLDGLDPGKSVYTKAHPGNSLSAAFAIILISIAGGGLLAGGMFPRMGWVGLYSPAIVITYLIALRTVHDYEKRMADELHDEMRLEPKYRHITRKDAFMGYGINAGAVVMAAVLLPYIGEGIATEMGLGQTFVGNVFIAVSTSLPEFVVTVSALRLGAVDLAVGNLFGSNVFNIFILALDDLFFVRGPLLSFVSRGHIVSAFSAMTMTAIAIVGLVYNQRRKKFFLSWVSTAMALVFFLNLFMLYDMR